MCPKTLDILSRVVALGINENWGEEDIKDISEKIKKVKEKI